MAPTSPRARRDRRIVPRRRPDPVQHLSPVFEYCDPGANVDLTRALLAGLADSKVAICLSDPDDTIRFTNAIFRTTFMPGLRDEPVNFVDAIAAQIRRGRGITLVGVALEDFIPRMRARRKNLSGSFSFASDMSDGSWWLINEHKFDSGWILVMGTNISSLKNEEFRLREDHAAALKASQTDHLTGLANRRQGLARAEAALEDHRRTRLPLSVALIDIDYFKRINDLHGHEMGDHVLVHFARTLIEGAGPLDQVSRIGGEEFLLVMPETSAAKARINLGRFTYGIPPLVTGQACGPLPVTASAGLAQAHHAESLTDLLHRADVALYEAKAKGRHRTELCPRFAETRHAAREKKVRSEPADRG